MEAMPGAQDWPCRESGTRGHRRLRAGSEARAGCQWQPRGGPSNGLSRAMPCGRSCLAVQALLLALLVFAEEGQSRRGVAEGLSDSPVPGNGVANGTSPNEQEDPCPSGYRFISFDGSCERDITVHPRTRLVAMSIATLIGVGVPVLFCLLLATCHIGLWDDLASDIGEENDDEAKDMPSFEKVNSLDKTDSEPGGPFGPSGTGYTPPNGDQEPTGAGYAGYTDVNSPSRRGVELNDAFESSTAGEPRSPNTEQSFPESEERSRSRRKPSNCGVESWLISISAEAGPDYGPGSYLASCSSATPV